MAQTIYGFRGREEAGGEAAIDRQGIDGELGKAGTRPVPKSSMAADPTSRRVATTSTVPRRSASRRPR